MNLITPLTSGVKGAEGGTAQLRRRGTSTPATWYDAFEADGNSFTSDVVLDSNGGATAYVNEIVDVTVYDTAGTVVRRFTAGQDAPAVELKSQSFTGTNYESGSSAAGEPTTVQTALDLVKTSFGALDFKVTTPSGDQLVKDAIAPASLAVYNVTSTAYGATGDGVTDDSAAVQAAINAAEAAGSGMVYFPTGTYFCQSVLNCTGDLVFAGDGQELSVLKMDFDAGSTMFSLDAGTRTVFRDLAIEHDASTDYAASVVVLRLSGDSCSFERCRLGSATGLGNTARVISLENGTLDMFTTRVYVSNPASGSALTSALYLVGSNTPELRAVNCTFESVGAGNATTVHLVYAIAAAGCRCFFANCKFKPSGGTVLSRTFYVNEGNEMAFVGCDFLDNGTATTSTHLFGNTATTVFAVAAGCLFDNDSLLTNDPSLVRVSEERGTDVFGTDDSASISTSFRKYNVVTLSRSSSAAQTINIDDAGNSPDGSLLLLEITASGGSDNALISYAAGTETTSVTPYQGYTDLRLRSGGTVYSLFTTVGGDVFEIQRWGRVYDLYEDAGGPTSVTLDVSDQRAALLTYSSGAPSVTVTFDEADSLPDGALVHVIINVSAAGPASITWAAGTNTSGLLDNGVESCTATNHFVYTFVVYAGIMYLTGTELGVS